jgi:ATP-binding cassette subfamily B multidrug efflux pump
VSTGEVDTERDAVPPADRSDDDVIRTTGRAARGGTMSYGSAAMPIERSSDLAGTVRRLGKVVGPEAPVLVIAGGLALVSVALTVLGPRLLGSATDILVNGARAGAVDTGQLRDRLVTVALIYLAAWAFGYAHSFVLTGAVQRSMSRLRDAVEAKLHRLPLAYLDGESRGDLLSRVTNDIENLTQSLQQSASQIVTSLLTLVGVLAMMLLVSPLLTVVALVTVPAAIGLSKSIARRARPRFMEQWRATGELNGQAEEAFSGHAIITSFGRRDDVIARFAADNDRLFGASRSAQFTAGLMQPVSLLLGNLQFVAIAVVGGLRISSGSISIGAMQAMLQYSRQFAQPLQQVGSVSATFQSGLASLERVVELLDAEEVTADPPRPSAPAAGRGRVAFEGVHFAYTPDRPLLTGLDLVAEPGQAVAIVGPTGAGKTTLVNLLLRFYDVDAGRITLDGIDISTMPRRELRSRFGMVLQDTWLFGGSIRENIRYGNPAATDAEVLDAAQVAYVDRFVHALPDGFDTVMNDEGDNISAGEKQLITIARAFLADPSILILDEATSSVDTRTEVLIQEATSALRANRTSFVIAHRLSTIRGADTIVVMDGGRIVEQGRHEELLAHGGPYAQLHAAQFAGRST